MPRWINVILIVLLILFIFSFSLTPLRSTNDAWWHLKSGKIILERKSLPENDVFAYTSEDIAWHNHEWLAQVVFYMVYSVGGGEVQDGIRMVILFKAFILLGAYLLIFYLAWRETKSIPVAVLAAFWAVTLSRRTIYPRPPLVTYLFFAFTLYLLIEKESGRISGKWLWILVPLMIFWANLHGGFLLGLIAIGAWFGSEVIKVVIKKKTFQESEILFFGGLLASCVAASLVNPYTYHLYLLPGRVMSDVGLVRAIPELRSPDFFYTRGFEYLILFLAAAPLLVKKKAITLPEGLLLIFFMHQGLQHVRHVPLVGIVAAVPVARVLKIMKEEYLPVKFKPVFSSGVSLLFVLIMFYTLVSHKEGESFLERNLNYIKGAGYYENRYPVQEADFILANNFTGRMFNPINQAGYLIWRLSPEHHKVFTDSRYDIFGGRFMRLEHIVRAGLNRDLSEESTTWDDVLERWNVNFLLIEGTDQVQPLLEESDDWELVYHRLEPYSRSYRNGFMIYVKNIPGNSDLIRRARYSASRAGFLPENYL